MKSPNTEAAQLLAKRILDMGSKEMTAHEQRVTERVAKRLAVSRNINIEHDKSYTFGERLADRVASFGGSWTFLIIFAAILIGWVVLNSVMLAGGFDPYPYILLNLFLSMLEQNEVRPNLPFSPSPLWGGPGWGSGSLRKFCEYNG